MSCRGSIFRGGSIHGGASWPSKENSFFLGCIFTSAERRYTSDIVGTTRLAGVLRPSAEDQCSRWWRKNWARFGEDFLSKLLVCNEASFGQKLQICFGLLLITYTDHLENKLVLLLFAFELQ